MTQKKIPNILYHGTTSLRWNMIQKDGMMLANLPMSPLLPTKVLGHLYFTDSVNDAITHSLIRFLIDGRGSTSVTAEDALQKHSTDSSVISVKPNIREAHILAVKTSNLRHNFEIDPEMETSQRIFESMEISDKSTWYRHKGDIGIKHLFLYKVADLPQWDVTVLFRRMEYGMNEMKRLTRTMKQSVWQPNFGK